VTDVVQLAPGVRLSAMDTSTLDTTYMAHMPDDRRLQLSEQLYHLMRCMDNPRSLAALADDFCQQTGGANRIRWQGVGPGQKLE